MVVELLTGKGVFANGLKSDEIGARESCWYTQTCPGDRLREEWNALKGVTCDHSHAIQRFA